MTAKSQPETSEFPAFLQGGGTLGGLIRAHPWADTPLGPPRSWPQSLQSALSICLHSSFPTAIYWGPDLRLLYNDAWAPIPAERHPWALGRPGAEVWSDIWHVVGPQFARVMETGEGFSTYDQMLPMERDGQPRETYWNYSFTAIRGEDGSIVGVFNQGNETTASVLARKAAGAEIERLAGMFAQAPGAVAILRGPAHEFEIVNPAYEDLVGRGNLIGRTVRQALPEVSSQGFIELLDRVYATGEPHVGHAVPLTLTPDPDGATQERVLDFVYQPLFDGHGDCSGIFVQATDITEQYRSEEARKLILREMDHRVKNLFSIASGMVSMTARSTSTVNQMAESLRGRLSALARSHGLIRIGVSEEHAHEVTALRPLLETVLEPHVESQATTMLGGPEVPLGGKAVTVLALVFHELATNAAKYGGLSSPANRLAVEWSMTDGLLDLDWTEQVSDRHMGPPKSFGFGSQLARSSVTQQLNGEIEFDWRPVGVRVSIRIPQASLAN